MRKYLKSRYLMAFMAIMLLLSCGSPSADQSADRSDSNNISADSISRLDQLNDLIKKNDQNPDYYYERANLFLEEGDIEFAFEDINEAITLDSTNSVYFITLGNVHVSRGKPQTAIIAFETALRLDHENIEAMLKLAEVSILFDNDQGAAKMINQVLSLNDLEPRAYFLRGMIWLKNADTVTGIKNFLKAIEVDQGYFDGHLQLGRLYALKGSDLAENYFLNAHNIEPLSPEPLYHLGSFYQSRNQFDKAIETYKDLLQTTPAYFYAAYNIGYIYLVEKSDFEAAADYFQQALDMNPNYANAWYNKGYAEELMGKLSEAEICYKQALQIRPDFDLAKNRLENLEN